MADRSVEEIKARLDIAGSLFTSEDLYYLIAELKRSRSIQECHEKIAFEWENVSIKTGEQLKIVKKENVELSAWHEELSRLKGTSKALFLALENFDKLKKDMRVVEGRLADVTEDKFSSDMTLKLAIGDNKRKTEEILKLQVIKGKYHDLVEFMNKKNSG